MKKRLFLIVFFLGFAGVLSILLLDLSAIASLLPGATEIPFTPAVKILGLIHPTVIVGAAVLIGVALTPRVGLSAPAAESLAAGKRVLPALKPQLIPGVLGGLAGGLS